MLCVARGEAMDIGGAAVIGTGAPEGCHLGGRLTVRPGEAGAADERSTQSGRKSHHSPSRAVLRDRPRSRAHEVWGRRVVNVPTSSPHPQSENSKMSRVGGAEPRSIVTA